MKKSFIFIFITFIFSPNLYADVFSSIKSSGQLNVCIWPEYYGISYIDPRTQKIAGIDADLASELAKVLDVKLALIHSSFGTFINDLNSNKCDIAMFAIGRTEKRIAQLTLTTPHLSSDVYAIANKNNQRIQTWDDIDKKGVVVAVARGTYHVDLMKKSLKNATLVITDRLGGRESEVESGRADVFMGDYPFGIRMLKQSNWAKLIKPNGVFHMTPYGWAMKKGEDAFLNEVENFIKTIKKDGLLAEIAKKYDLLPIVKKD